MADLWFEDVVPGAVTTFGHHRVDRDRMVAFARAFDPQPFHLDEAAAAATPTGRLIASGWYSAALQMRLFVDGWFGRAAGLGGAGVEELRWLRPIVVGDEVSVRQTMHEARISRSKPDMGILRFSLDLLTQDGTVAMSLTQLAMIGRRGRPYGPIVVPHEAVASEPEPAWPHEDAATAPVWYEDVEIGRGVDLGCHGFPAENIKAFAREFDPQAYHLDETAAARGPFGALCASGWHTAAGFMSRAAARFDRLGRAGRRPRVGVSPGVRDLKWLRPVYAGETIRYESEPVAKRPLASRPGWGLVTSRTTGRNGHGETVFGFTGNVLWQMRGPA